jgi:hypothetical protein
MTAGTTPASDDTPRRRPGRPPADASEGVVETRDRILGQAKRLFMQRDFAAVSVGDVAAAVGVTKPTIYYRPFRNAPIAAARSLAQDCAEGSGPTKVDPV